ncbi:MAG: GNAT family N-acetyltransferase [Clostridium sp.]|nr:MAG: GNAT family N-acetyltransferase [Clostridium sp.]
MAIFMKTKKKTSYIEIGSKCFEIDEIYVTKGYRNKGIGQKNYLK